MCTLLNFPTSIGDVIRTFGKWYSPLGSINTDLSYTASRFTLIVIKSSYIATLHSKFLVGSNQDIVFHPAELIESCILNLPGYLISSKISVPHSLTGDG